MRRYHVTVDMMVPADSAEDARVLAAEFMAKAHESLDLEGTPGPLLGITITEYICEEEDGEDEHT